MNVAFQPPLALSTPSAARVLAVVSRPSPRSSAPPLPMRRHAALPTPPSYACQASDADADAPPASRTTPPSPLPSDALSPAERTRRALSADEPLVKFSRDTDYLDLANSDFAYTNGTTKGGFDVWLLIAVLTVVLPFALFAVGVATGYIDVNPR